jgi:hypothetical protein
VAPSTDSSAKKNLTKNRALLEQVTEHIQMKTSFSLKHFTSLALFLALFFVTGTTHSLWAANSIAPTLISQAGNTRAVAFESVTMNSEPFPVTSTVQFSPDNRTRICIFAMNLQLLAGEGVNAFTADAQMPAGSFIRSASSLWARSQTFLA